MIQVRISPAQRRKLESDLKVFADKSKVAVAETVAIIGTSVAKELARKVQPYGLTKKSGDSFELSIQKQINKAARYATFKGTEGSIEQIHTQYRNQRGAVTVKPPRQFQPARPTFKRDELDPYIDKKKANAGIAKAGWIAAGKSIGGSISAREGVKAWFNTGRHKRSQGTHQLIRTETETFIKLINQVPWADVAFPPSRKAVTVTEFYIYFKKAVRVRKEKLAEAALKRQGRK